MAVLLWFVVIYCNFKPWFSGFPSLPLPKITSKYLILGHFKDSPSSMPASAATKFPANFHFPFQRASITSMRLVRTRSTRLACETWLSKKTQRHDQPSKSGSHCWVSDTWKAQRPKLKKPAEKMWDDQAPNLHSCIMAKLHISHSFTEFHRVSQASNRSFERKPGFLIPWPCLIGMLEVGGRFRYRRQFNFIFPSP